MDFDVVVLDQQQRNADIVEQACADAVRSRGHGVEVWRLLDGDVVAFSTPSVPFGEIRFVDKDF